MLLYIQHHLTARNKYADYLWLSSQKMPTTKTAEAVRETGTRHERKSFRGWTLSIPTGCARSDAPTRVGLRHVASLRVLAAPKEFSRPEYSISGRVANTPFR